MENGKPDKSDTAGTEPNNDSTEAEKVKKDIEELKAKNDANDKEKLRAETIRAERARGGKSEAGQPGSNQEPSKEEKKKAQASKFFEGTALGDAIDKTK